MDETGFLRIGELSRRSGVSPALLRAWERRYGLLRPQRSAGGLRLYSFEDFQRVRTMQRHLAEGLAAAEAAALAARPEAGTAEAALAPEAVRRELEAALSAFDEARAQSTLDRLLGATTLDSVLSQVVLPYLRDLGDRWERGESSVAEEHFATGVLRSRLLGLTRGWDRGLGPRVLLACAPDERHDVGLVAFGLALRERGFRIFYLGADSPVDGIASAAQAVRPDFVVVSAVDGARFHAAAEGLRALGEEQTLLLGGAGAAEAEVDAPRLTGGAVDEADRLTGLVGAGRRPAPGSDGPGS